MIWWQVVIGDGDLNDNKGWPVFMILFYNFFTWIIQHPIFHFLNTMIYLVNKLWNFLVNYRYIDISTYCLCFDTISSIGHEVRGVRYLAIFYHHYKFNDIDCGSHYLWLVLLDKIGFSNCLSSDNNKSKRPSFVILWFALLH